MNFRGTLSLWLLVIAACSSSESSTIDAGNNDAGVADSSVDGNADAGNVVGSLVAVSASSTVGVLLDEFPATVRERVATELLAAPASYWIARAHQQLHLTDLKLIYRGGYYPESDNKQQLPLPPEESWVITLDAAGATRTTVDDHDLVAVNYTFTSTLLSDEESPGISEPALATVGGTWDEPFVFPIDPTLLLQRTGYACMDEDQFPAESVDAENAYQFYDDTCEVERPGDQACHLTLPLPEETCVDAVTNNIGHIETAVHFERLAWSPTVAASVRSGEITVTTASDMKVVTEGVQSLSNNRVIYKYIAADHCAVVESCVAGSGWRRLIEFDSMDHNVGAMPLHIGTVDYFVEGLGSELISHNVYVLSACHNHYHFEHYGDFSYGANPDSAIHKNGFCLETTGRLSNNETSPLHSPYNCGFQGVAPGWGDLYAAGLTCNWVDVTSVDTSAAPVTSDLTFHSNPDGFLCEGTLVENMGEQVWESTSFTTSAGEPVDRPMCMQAANTEINDTGSVPVTLPTRGGMMSTPCRDSQIDGPARNCGFAMQVDMPSCTAGESVTMYCSGATAATPEVVRMCETSQVLGTGVDCSFQDSLANAVVEDTAVMVEFTCPAARDEAEPGGQFAIYTAPVHAGDAASAITCVRPSR